MEKFLIENSEHGCYNATEVGLGKTIETIHVAESIPGKRLIICPAVMRYTWEKEIKLWTNASDVIVITKASELGGLAASWVIVSYDFAAKYKETLALLDFTTLVLDEAHYVKNAKAKRTRAILNHLWPKIPYRICLSGTPFTRSIADGYTLFHRLNPKAFPDFRTFTERYTNPRWNGFATVYEGIRNEKELSQIIRSSFYLRDTKAEVAPELPSKNWCRITLPNSLSIEHEDTEEEKKQHQFYITLLRQAIIENRPAPRPPQPIATKRRRQALKKCEAVAAFTKNLLEQELPVVVFAYHKAVIAQLESSLVAFGPVTITGETPAKDREKAIEAFQTGETNIILCNFQAGGIGITLTASCNVVLAELDYSPATISQAVARADRIGQKSTVNIYYLMIENSLEDSIMEILVNKADAFRKVVDAASN